ncbi:hypothetical protein niasHS_001972 [Heterodera schachtii]|uniref:Uncharacterized protein n=1 Tax=Heterodera schachtii TaxID=97005 RepID=A0ABD2K5G5_HETSC
MNASEQKLRFLCRMGPTAPPLLFEPFLQMGLSNMNQEMELLSKLSAAASQPAASISFICPNSAASSKVR